MGRQQSLGADIRGRPWLSVVMPVHRGEAWLAATLESLTEEAGAGVEIVLVDSSPDDRSFAIAERYVDRLALSIERRTDLAGWPEKTNYAVGLATASHIAMLHQDDLWLPGRRDALKAWIREAPAAALHLAPTLIVDHAGTKRGTWRCPLPTGLLSEAMLAARLPVQNFISVPAPIFRRDAFLAVGGLDAELWYTADWDLWIKLARHGAVHHHPEVTTAFRVHGNSLTMTGSRSLESFEGQLRTVLDRNRDWPAPATTGVAASISVALNVALAGLAAGDRGRLRSALWRLFAAGPFTAVRYIRYSRIVDRVLPRLRCKLAGGF